MYEHYCKFHLGANDLAVLFPRYLNIHRGCIVAAIIGAWVFVPWKIVATASNFSTFMGGYAIFLAPIAGIICSDYWIVKKRKIDIPALYDPYGRYRYWYGINWRAMLAFLVSFVPNFPGLINAVGSSTDKSIHITNGAKHLYSFDWLYDFVMSVVMYTTLSMVFPDHGVLVNESIRSLDVFEGQPNVVIDGEKSANTEAKSLDP